MADGFVQVPTDSTGKKIETTELTRPDASVVERQRVELPVAPPGEMDVLNAILVEIRLQNQILANGLNLRDDVDQMRNDLILSLTN